MNTLGSLWNRTSACLPQFSVSIILWDHTSLWVTQSGSTAYFLVPYSGISPVGQKKQAPVGMFQSIYIDPPGKGHSPSQKYCNDIRHQSSVALGAVPAVPPVPPVPPVAAVPAVPAVPAAPAALRPAIMLCLDFWTGLWVRSGYDASNLFKMMM